MSGGLAPGAATQTHSFLLELRSEEIPARMQERARSYLSTDFVTELLKAGINLDGDKVTVWSTPRRLALIAHGLPAATPATSEEVKGPRTSAPEQALEGFLRKTGLTKADLTARDGIWFATLEKPGRATADVLAEAIPAIIRGFAWPKAMRWGPASLSPEALRWVRPLQGIVALLDGEVVHTAVGDVQSGRATHGHRFHAPGAIAITSAATYAEQLRAAHVIVDHAERAALIREGAAATARAAGLTLVADEGLVMENAGLTEWPVPLLGRFDAAFLEVPPEVIQLTARVNQKYFVCEDGAGKLAPQLANAFICTANIAAKDGGAGVIAGNRKVLAARLSDARFFWQQDRRKTLAQHAEGLARITFHEKLGSVADKAARVAKLARWLAEEGIVSPLPLAGGAGGGSSQAAPPIAESAHPNPSRLREGLSRAELADLAEQAALLCKADLTTEMVGEFPELQGLMGGYYARAEGLPDAVADAIRDHYKPVGQGDDVPTAPVTVCVALADKLDTIAQFFAVGQAPTGSKDPFALRRSALGVLALIQENELRFDISAIFAGLINFLGSDDELMGITQRRFWSKSWFEIQAQYKWDQTHEAYPEPLESTPQVVADLQKFFADRLKVQQREAGVRHDLIDAVFALGGEGDLVRLLARVHALQAFIATPDGANLLAGYKRAANILKKSPLPLAGGAGGGHEPNTSPAEEPTPNPSRMREGGTAPEPAEAALIAALAAAEPLAAAALAAEDFAAAMAVLASLRAPIDAFFEQVTVNAADPAIRAARLGLLAAFRAAVHKVADFSRIEG